VAEEYIQYKYRTQEGKRMESKYLGHRGMAVRDHLLHRCTAPTGPLD